MHKSSTSYHFTCLYRDSYCNRNISLHSHHQWSGSLLGDFSICHRIAFGLLLPRGNCFPHWNNSGQCSWRTPSHCYSEALSIDIMCVHAVITLYLKFNSQSEHIVTRFGKTCLNALKQLLRYSWQLYIFLISYHVLSIKAFSSSCASGELLGNSLNSNFDISVFSKLHSQSKSTLGCYIVKTTVSVASNHAPYER